MSVAALNAVWTHSAAATPAELSVLLALADWADAYGYCYPSYQALARRARVCERQAQRVIAKFVDLGEIEKHVGGHRVSTPGHRPGRTGLQPRNLYRFTGVPDEKRGDVTSPLPITVGATTAPGRDGAASSLQGVEGVTPDPERGDTSDRKGVTPATSHIRKIHQEDPSDQPPGGRAAAASTKAPTRRSEAAAELDAFRCAWNAETTRPLLPVHTLTATRRRLMRARLVERPLEVQRALIRRLNASSFCRGVNRRGFVASLDWFISSPDPAVKAAEGQYDDQFSAADLREACEHRFRVASGRCVHTPTCASDEDCLEAIAIWLRQRRAS